MLRLETGRPSERSVDPLGLGTARALFFRLAGVTAGPCGAAATASAAALVASLAPADWADLRALARREEVTAALWPRLRAALPAAGSGGGGVVPGEVEEAFRREAMVAEFGARRLEAQLQEVLATLAARGIEPVLLKGAGLAHTVFAGIARRPMRDLDLLVTRDELAPALAALRAAGWREDAGARPSERYESHQHAAPLVAPGGGAGGGVVELHDTLFARGHPFRLDGGAVLARSRRVPSALGAVRVPSPVHQLLHACLHFAWSHEMRWGAWRAVADVAALVAAAAAEDAAPAEAGSEPTARALDEVVEEAWAVGGASAAYWTMRLAATLGEVPVPEPWLAGLAGGAGGGAGGGGGAVRGGLLERHLAHQLAPGPGNVPSVALARLAWRLAIRPGRSGHGGSRPWSVGTGGQAGEGGEADGGWAGRRLAASVARQAASPGRWIGYARALFPGGSRAGGGTGAER